MTSHSSWGRGVFKYSSGETVRTTVPPFKQEDAGFPEPGTIRKGKYGLEKWSLCNICHQDGHWTSYTYGKIWHTCDPCRALVILGR